MGESVFCLIFELECYDSWEKQRSSESHSVTKIRLHVLDGEGNRIQVAGTTMGEL